MAAWWDALSALERFFYIIAAPATLILVIQFVLSIIGFTGGSDADSGGDTGGDIGGDTGGDLSGDIHGDFAADAHDGMDADSDAGGADFRLVSFRTVIAFLTVFAWTGIVLVDRGVGVGIVFIGATLAGFAAMLGVGYLFYLTAKLQYSGNIKYKNAVGHTAEVYIPLLRENGYSGKVQVIIQGQLVEASAIARDKREHRTGEIVMTVGVAGLSTLLVESISESEPQ